MTSPLWSTGYCTNVHAGTDLDEIRRNLDQHATAVRDSLDPARSLGVGLWIPSPAASQLDDPVALATFRDWLAERRLHPFTINGFPYGNFHEKRVKHRVYEPAWWDDNRRTYTERLIRILDGLLPPTDAGSISTLPIGWGSPHPAPDALQRAADNLRGVGRTLAELEAESGRRICLAIEPEPGCVLERSTDVVAFFERYLPEPELRRYLTVCHDTCHAAVMFEAQSEVLGRYRDADLVVGKVQVSSAIEVRWYELGENAGAAMQQLSAFAEDRYLHQTCRLQDPGEPPIFEEDLPALVGGPPPEADRMWRVHFHVPIYLEQFGYLHTTHDAVDRCLRDLKSADAPEFLGHLEAETYAWSVLPGELQRPTLADGIAEELRWLAGRL